MITYADAFTMDHFHIGHDGTPCIVWERCGVTHTGPGEGQFFVPIARGGEDGPRDWHHITGVNAADFHTPAMCPHAKAGNDSQPPAAGNSDRSEPVLASGFGADGYDLFGFDADGYDREGYDTDGYDSGGYNRDGYDEDDRDRYGNARPGSLDASDLDLAELWGDFRYGRFNTPSKQAAFKQHLESLVSDPGEIDELRFCGSCDEPGWGEDLSVARGDTSLCESCWSDWLDCGRCEERYPDDELYEMLTGSDVCGDCRSSYYSFCEDCNGYYDDDDAGEHAHDSDDDDCCASPQTEFTIRNDGCAPLANDVRITITLPAGTISDEGLLAIRNYLLSQAEDAAQRCLAYDLAPLGDQWQTRTGNYTKRLSRHAYQTQQVKLRPDVLSQVGCIARDHSSPVNVEIETTRELNMSSSDFYHDGSCWWNSYSESRCALKTNGGFGLRTFNKYGGVRGRAWVMPLRKNESERLRPTFDTMTPDAFIVFNGYGDLSGYAAARIAAHMAGWTYRKIDFRCEPMYVNAGGYLVASEEIVKQYADSYLSLTVDQHSSLFRTETERALVNA
jgi:hypothetical protein